MQTRNKRTRVVITWSPSPVRVSFWRQWMSDFLYDLFSYDPTTR